MVLTVRDQAGLGTARLGDNLLKKVVNTQIPSPTLAEDERFLSGRSELVRLWTPGWELDQAQHREVNWSLLLHPPTP